MSEEIEEPEPVDWWAWVGRGEIRPWEEGRGRWVDGRLTAVLSHPFPILFQTCRMGAAGWLSLLSSFCNQSGARWG